MTDQEAPGSSGERPGRERRQEDRRAGNRRQDQARGPAPIWRRPAAYVAYGLLSALLFFLVVQPGQEREAEEDDTPEVAEGSRVRTPRPPGMAGSIEPTREAFTLAQYEELVAEGQDAVGEVVRTELFCGSIMAVTTSDAGAESVLAPLKDAQGQVAGADCRWSREARTSDFLLVIPPDLAEEFADAPEVELDFVMRRTIPADVEWLGRTEALSLRTAGILRNIR